MCIEHETLRHKAPAGATGGKPKLVTMHSTLLNKFQIISKIVQTIIIHN